MLFLLLGLSALAAPVVFCSQLPSFGVGEHGLDTANLEREGRWWASIGGRVYFAPPPDTGLSEHVSDYAYAVGSRSALPAALLQQRVGGTGRFHIFHLRDGGAQLLQVDQAAISGSRRSSYSQLQRVTHGMKLDEFPHYELHDRSYVNPLEKSGHAHMEQRAVKQLTPDGIMAFLSRITTLPNAEHPTRSANNRDATKAVQQFLLQEFDSLKFTTCRHESHMRGLDLANIVGFVPGSPGLDTVIVGAHYDSIPQDGAAPGAEDNGSGLAVLLAMAHAFAKSGQRPKKNVYFVGFAGEEAGLLGSEAFAQDFANPHGKLPQECRPQRASFLQKAERAGRQQAIIMDEVGWLSAKLAKPTVNLESYDWTAEDMDHLASSSWKHNGNSLDVVHSANPFGSDHISFLRRNMSAVLTINGDDEAYPAYHSSEDRISNVDATLMYQIAKMNMGALVRMAGVQPAASKSTH